MAYDYAALEALNNENTGSMLAGELSPQVINQIAQQAAERGVSTGTVNSPAARAAYLSAIGRSSLDLQKQGQVAFDATRTAQLEAERQAEAKRQFDLELAQKASQFEANMSFQEKQLAQQLGISNQQYALEMARLEMQQSQFTQSLSLEEKKLAQELGLSEAQLAFQKQQLAQSGSQFSAQLGQQATQFQQTLAQQQLQAQLDEAFRKDQLAQQAELTRLSTLSSLASPAPYYTTQGQNVANAVLGAVTGNSVPTFPNYATTGGFNYSTPSTTTSTMYGPTFTYPQYTPFGS